MQPHARPYPSLTQVHTYLYTYVNAYTYIDIHVCIHTCKPSLLRAAISAHGNASACACPHVSAHTRARASAVPPRTTARAASNTRPSASRPRWRAARAEKAAHTPPNSVTEAVSHAPMLALNADAPLNTCEPSHTTPAEGARMCRRRCVGAQSHSHTRAQSHGRSTRAHYTVCVRVPSMDGLTKRARCTRARAAH